MTRILAIALASVLVTAPAFAQVGKSLGVVDANNAGEADLAAMPGMTAAIARALVATRPFDNIVALNAFLLGQSLTQEQANDFYRSAFLHIDLNTATVAEILLVPGAGKRMAREFAEYRPWKPWAQLAPRGTSRSRSASRCARPASAGSVADRAEPRNSGAWRSRSSA